MSTAPRRNTPLLIVGIVVFTVVVTVLAYRTFARTSPLRQDAGSFADFRDASYYPAVAFNDGHDPYDVTTYLARYPVAQVFPLYAPHFLLFNEPFTLLSLAWARTIHFMLTVVLAGVTAWFLQTRAALRARLGMTLLVAAAVVASLPGRFVLQTGQSTMVTVLACYVAWHFATRRPVGAGIALVFAAMKPIIGLPFAGLLLAAKPARRAVGTGALITAAAIAPVLAILVVAAGGVGNLIDHVRDNIEWVNSLPQVAAASSPFRVDAVSNVARLLDWSPPALIEVGIAVLIVVIAAVALFRGRRAGLDDRSLPLLVAALAVLLSGFQPTYHLLLLVWPLHDLLLRPSSFGTISSRMRWTLCVLLAWPALSPFTRQTVFDRFGAKTLWVELLGPTLSGACLLAAFVLCLRELTKRTASPRVSSFVETAP